MKDISYLYYDHVKGWAGTNPGWHEVNKYPVSDKNYEEMVEWMYESLDNVEKHARWFLYDKNASFKFRYERDYIWFKLRWL